MAVLVIAVGLLGVASLQGNALRANRAGYERSQAAILADDMAERMRLNAQAARAGAYDHSLSDETKSSAPAPVDQDIADWNDRVEASLPGGRGAVSTGGACPNCVTVTIEIKRRDTGATETMQFETRL